VFIHIFGVPALLWSVHVSSRFLPSSPLPAYPGVHWCSSLSSRYPPLFPAAHHVFSGFLVFDMNTSALLAAFYLGYYILLDPVAAVSLLAHGRFHTQSRPDQPFNFSISSSMPHNWSCHYSRQRHTRIALTAFAMRSLSKLFLGSLSSSAMGLLKVAHQLCWIISLEVGIMSSTCILY
jgi:hypothetical protein